jgi:hypothetical protein
MESATHYRLRAQESRTIAKGIFDHEERKKLLQIAAEFELLALRCTEQDLTASSGILKHIL